MAGWRLCRVSWDRTGHRPVAHVTGDVDADAYELVTAIITVADATAPRLLEVDLAGVTFVDVAGLDQLIRLAAVDNLQVQRASPVIVSLLERLGLDVIPGASVDELQ